MGKLLGAVAERLGVTPCKLVLFLDGCRALDDVTLFDMGAHNGDEFDVLFAQMGC